VRLKHLTFIAMELKENSEGFYTEHKIPKGRGQYRIVYSVSPALAKVQEKLKALFEEILPSSGTSFAYEKGVRICDTAQRIHNTKLLVTLDFKDHFSSVTMWQVTKMLEDYGACSQVAFLIARLCCITRFGRSFLPQGSVVSPLLSNRVCEHLLDGALATEFSNATITRYSDNLFLAFDTNEVNGNEVIEKVQKLVRAKTNWRCHKCRVMPYYRRQRGLGLVLNEKSNMPREKYLSIKALLYNLANKDPLIELEKAKRDYRLDVDTLPELIEKIKCQLVYWRQFLTENRFNKLQTLLQEAEIKCIQP
tara:strand:+ start:1624 stop:2544 length:921 start_codon:yes stop_codon:yes gene_type:complete